MTDAAVIRYEVPLPKVARITLDRADTRNAQDTRLLYELNDAFDRGRAGRRDQGHHPGRRRAALLRRATTCASATRGDDGGVRAPSAPGAASAAPAPRRRWRARRRSTSGFRERWRNIPKPTIAEVQGKVIAGGLMLVWPCDLIVAADDATFCDNTVAMGVCGAEYFTHPWELGARKAKEMLFTVRLPVAPRRHDRLGMVNHVVARDELTDVHAGARRAGSPRSRCSR